MYCYVHSLISRFSVFVAWLYKQAMLCISFGTICKILTISWTIGIVQTRTPASGIMLHATVWIVLQDCKQLHFGKSWIILFIYTSESCNLSYVKRNSLCKTITFLLQQWYGKCIIIWSTGSTACTAYKFAVFVSHFFLPSVKSYIPFAIPAS